MTGGVSGDGVKGWALAVGSLRDYYERGGDPSQAGADFASEAQRLGEATGTLHAYSAEAFGVHSGEPAEWTRLMIEQLETVEHPQLDRSSALRVFGELNDLDDPGPQIRIHGNLHLGEVVRTEKGWSVFEGDDEPGLQERPVSSPLKDVAGMMRSFHYAAWSTMLDHHERPVHLAKGWADRNRQAFLEGYVAVANLQGSLLPHELVSMEFVLKAFELDKAVAEIAYEQAHRPEWIEVPLASIERLC
ncbi:MAG: hypothetical protein ACRDIU_06825 [Actinomycetota bacterium]